MIIRLIALPRLWFFFFFNDTATTEIYTLSLHDALPIGRDGAVRFLDLVTGKLRTASTRHDGAVVRAAFSADGRAAVTAGADNRVIVWNVERAAAAETLAGNAAQITGLAISRGAQTLYTAALDGKVLIWDLAGDRRLGRPFDIGPSWNIGPLPIDIGPPLNHALSPD